MTVYLVGAGPGDPGLITVRGAELLGVADVVVYDRLAESSLLDLVPPAAELVYVGKTPGGPVDQDGITALLVDRGQRGLEVVRLKGGDPFLFGRGGEEAEALMAAGVPFEVVPGVTSSIAVPAYAGVPVTHRGLSASVTFVTGHSRQEAEVGVNWDAIAQSAGTLVISMGVAHRAEIADRLMAAGMDPTTPVVSTTWGTRPDQRSVRTTLAGLGDAAIEPPAAIVVGAVAGLDLRWFEGRPLFGRRVVVTRAREQASGLVVRLQQLGAEVIEVPTIAFAPPADGGDALERAAAAVSAVDWVAFTSTNAVDALFAHLRDARALGGVSVAAIGSATVAALADRGVDADLVPARAEGAALADAFPDGPGRVLLPQADRARPMLRTGLAAKGWEVDIIEAYRTMTAAVEPAVLAAAITADAITFTSTSTVQGWVEAAGRDAMPPCVVCIGEQTASAARDLGIAVDVVASEPSVNALVEAVVAALGSPAEP